MVFSGGCLVAVSGSMFIKNVFKCKQKFLILLRNSKNNLNYQLIAFPSLILTISFQWKLVKSTEILHLKRSVFILF